MSEETPQLTDREFQLFQRYFEGRIGLHLAPHKKLLLSGRLSRRVKALGMTSFLAYYDLVASGLDPSETQVAIDLITTHETYFFRENHHFELLRDVVAPSLAAGRTLRVWSAACSTGEEAYSIAMTLRHALGPSGWGVVASDIAKETLSKAATGLYSMDRTDGIPSEYLKDYCLRGRDRYEGMLLVSGQLRDKVEFHQINLTAVPDDLGLFDVVFLRNVIIYFDSATKQRVLETVCEHLRDGGLLLLGHSESIAGHALPLVQVRASVHRRTC